MDTNLDYERFWTPHLEDLAERIRHAARSAMASAHASGQLEHVDRPIGQGAGDVTFGLDEPTEQVLSAWLEERAREAPISLMTEDAGWRHRGPAPPGANTTRELPGFDHGGPRIAVDPIDGTRNLMADLRSAWTVISFCAPGPTQPEYADVSLGLVGEIPDSRAALYRTVKAMRGAGCTLRTDPLQEEVGSRTATSPLVSDADDRADNGYFPFFSYMHDQRPAMAAVQADFFARLARDEGANVRSCYDDQYISNAGQLVLLALGTYRMIVDARAWIARRDGMTTIASKPYDVAGALLCAEEAGCVLRSLDGEALAFPIDTETAVGFVGFANAGTYSRLWRHLDGALGGG
ncbi:MAG: fructose-1,6-bisphosphatase/inositol monophosphatase family enzyme [Chlamydiales bacterium]|jgi:fructose-1,6-bisphosphatase/inositol monophosphatase family enzyme